MIRINLAGDSGAGWPEPPGRMGRAGGGRTLRRLLALGMMLGGATVVLNWRTEQAARSRSLEVRIGQVSRQRQQHQELARKLQGLEQVGRSIEGRVRAIEQLRAQQARPVRVLDVLSDCVEAVPGLRLQELSRKDGAFSLRGLVSGDSSRVSEFIARLQRTGEFHRVELIHFQEQNGHDAFTLSFEGAATGPPPHQPSPAGSASATPPLRRESARQGAARSRAGGGQTRRPLEHRSPSKGESPARMQPLRKEAQCP